MPLSAAACCYRHVCVAAAAAVVAFKCATNSKQFHLFIRLLVSLSEHFTATATATGTGDTH